ncbi:chemotaxis protein CheW [Sedimenticola thiotaurini]|nr:chemotaxis protein CheW [Sedimenticola thiotaurini]
MSSKQTSTEVRGVLLPMREGRLLLPNAAVCEVVSFRTPDKAPEGAPSWVLGTFRWRNHVLPLISFEQLQGGISGEIGNRARVAICNTLNGSEQLPYIGILLHAAPHLTLVSQESLTPFLDDEPLHEMVASRVIVNGVDALIPDLDALESALSGVPL